ncbi:Glycosyltransferase-like domain-containing protein 1 [Mactra antiquata]
MARVLLIESFYSGSHKQLIDLLRSSVPSCEVYTLPGKKWHWKARTSALCLSQEIPKSHIYRVLFASSVLNLAELIALRPDLGSLHKVLYFHENQLIYPVRNEKERDFQFGYNQIISSLVADTVLFNSKYNMDSFLGNINTFLKLIPDQRPKNIPDIIRPKCEVLNFPISFPDRTRISSTTSPTNICSDTQPDDCPSTKYSSSSKHVTDNIETENAMEDNFDRSFSCVSNVGKVDGMDLQQCTDVKPESLNNLCTCTKSVESQVSVNTPYPADHCNTTIDVSTTFTDEKCLLNIDDQELVSVKSSLTNESPRSLNFVDNDVNSGLSKCESSIVIMNTDCYKDENDCNIPGDINEDVKHKDTRTVSMKQTLDTWEHSRPAKQSRISTQKDSVHIVWPHRWEHDKDPEMFFRVMIKLNENGLDFKLSVLGETFHEVPDVFNESLSILGNKIKHWGYQTSKQDYYKILSSADCVISTSNHEFFGVAMLEAVHLGCYPVCPNKLVYPEIFPKECLYNTEVQLYKKLREMCRKPYIVRNKQILIDTKQYSWEDPS